MHSSAATTYLQMYVGFGGEDENYNEPKKWWVMEKMAAFVVVAKPTIVNNKKNFGRISPMSSSR